MSVIHATFSADSNCIFTTACFDTRIWDANSGELLNSINIGDATFSPDGNRIVTRGDPSYVYDVTSGEAIYALGGEYNDDNPVSVASFSPDGNIILTVDFMNSANIWDATNGEPLDMFMHDDGEVIHAAFSPDSNRIVTTADDNTALVWHLPRDVWSEKQVKPGSPFWTDNKPIARLVDHEGSINCAAFSPDGNNIFTRSNDKTVKIWESVSGKLLTTLAVEGSDFIHSAFSPDGKLFVTVDSYVDHNNSAFIWDVATSKQLVKLEHFDDQKSAKIIYAAFSPDSKRIVTTSNDNTARIWDAASGELLVVLTGHKDVVKYASFSPKGRRIVTASHDNTAIVWDTESGEILFVLAGFATSLQLSTDELSDLKTKAEQGHIDAQLNLGMMYYHGHEITQDYKLAFYWFQKAAEQGESLAQYRLGNMYSKGEGVTQDFIEAHKWLSIAEKNVATNIKEVKNLRADIENRMAQEQIADAQKKAKEWIEN